MVNTNTIQSCADTSENVTRILDQILCESMSSSKSQSSRVEEARTDSDSTDAVRAFSEAPEAAGFAISDDAERQSPQQQTRDSFLYGSDSEPPWSSDDEISEDRPGPSSSRKSIDTR